MTSIDPQQLNIIRECSRDEAAFNTIMQVINGLCDIQKRERARMEHALQIRNDTLEHLIRASNDGFWDWFIHTGEIYFSPRWKHMIGYTDAEFPNSLQNWRNVIFPEDAESALKLVEDYNSGKVPEFVMTQRFRHKNGSTVYILSRAIHLKDEQGQVYRMIGAHTDITELVQAREAAEAANRAKSAFMAGITHELRTPLNAILGFAQLMEESPELMPQHQQHIQVIKERSKHLLEMINRILEVSRLGAIELEGINKQESMTTTRLLRSIASNAPHPEAVPAPSRQLSDALKHLPQDWLAALKTTATELDGNAATMLINQLYHQHPQLAEVLWHWVEEFHFNKILEIIGEVENE